MEFEVLIFGDEESVDKFLISRGYEIINVIKLGYISKEILFSYEADKIHLRQIIYPNLYYHKFTEEEIGEKFKSIKTLNMIRFKYSGYTKGRYKTGEDDDPIVVLNRIIGCMVLSGWYVLYWIILYDSYTLIRPIDSLENIVNMPNTDRFKFDAFNVLYSINDEQFQKGFLIPKYCPPNVIMKYVRTFLSSSSDLSNQKLIRIKQPLSNLCDYIKKNIPSTMKQEDWEVFIGTFINEDPDITDEEFLASETNNININIQYDLNPYKDEILRDNNIDPIGSVGHSSYHVDHHADHHADQEQKIKDLEEELSYYKGIVREYRGKQSINIRKSFDEDKINELEKTVAIQKQIISDLERKVKNMAKPIRYSPPLKDFFYEYESVAGGRVGESSDIPNFEDI